ncbi:MAG: hypothetical protein U1D67_06740 [Dehalococcoidia bacterium]|nr:hypothetical protein [Dehalococcoidia bacterium]
MTAYILQQGRLVGIQDNMGSWPVSQVNRLLRTCQLTGRTAIIADQGVSVCCSCHEFLHLQDIPEGLISHGYCKKHYQEALILAGLTE